MPMNIYVTSLADRSAIDCATAMTPEQFLNGNVQADKVFVEPTFYDFSMAGNSELSFPFLALNAAKTAGARSVYLALTYTVDNARKYRGYIIDLKEAVQAQYEHVAVKTVPYVVCGVPMAGTILLVVGSNTPINFPADSTPVMPSDFFPGLLAHVPRNRPNFPIMTSSRFLGAVRSDMNILPPVRQWEGRSLFVEYKRGKTTEMRRMLPEHIGQLFGVQPCQYTNDLMLVVPSGVLNAFLGEKSP